MKKIDLLTPLGIILGVIVIGLAVFSAGDMEALFLFMQLASFLIVFGGVFAALLVNFSMKELRRLPMIIKEGFKQSGYDLQEITGICVELSKKARREGLLALDPHLEDKVDDPFIRKGMSLAIDGIEPDVVQDIMMAEVISMEERHKRGRRILERAGDYAPAWGMVGTIVALVIMLNDLNDPAVLGPSMALAMLTTLYGAIVANLVCNPLASKLENKTELEAFAKQIIIEGVLGVQSGQNPKVLEEKLKAFVRREDTLAKRVEETGELVNET